VSPSPEAGFEAAGPLAFGRPYTLRVAAEPAAALAAVGRAAEEWGAAWEAGSSGGRLELPVSAGLRHGRLSGPIAVSAAGAGEAELAFQPERSEYHLWLPAIVVLVAAAAGAALTVVWPFYPQLLPVAPFGAIAALGGWFLVVTRLQNRGAEEFLELVKLAAAGPPESEGPAEDAGIPGGRARL
jgi:hypothetical protein